ncbi:diaminobutyrate acetyltransferase [Roseospira marina]|uniref:L-2,4-diaminobutyric acid acetyltransferase n=1 Tax=Roseospira marina TaxID=140057 RepID=A0A5M6IGP2_9PROT|nr:diaminobutyrate acetyltransferase [Roseospira marina]KAA5607332.1 diaminobutyrate acetyltransferase [Roseospira marina]MBB4312505.1 L-2,4-diaminobutyric acid acetyltransferase [Roseospira marina]MBB5085479.1 L-2,4-diaminobutyric acid acetyltransferase [Roseospira marina]
MTDASVSPIRSTTPTPTTPTPPAIKLRRPTGEDGATIWQLARDSGKLDLNSPYAYMMMSHFFPDTCVVAEIDGEPVGSVVGFAPPARPNALFVWQVTTTERVRGQGLASRMIEHLLWNAPLKGQARWLEATVTPSNEPSARLFKGIARRHGVACEVAPLFEEDSFPCPTQTDATFEPEHLFRIGPLRQAKAA